MQQFEDRLRSELRRTDGMPALRRDEMLARVSRVRRRRKVLATTAAAVTAVLAVTAAVPLVSRAGSDEAAAKPKVRHSATAINVIFTGPSHGYVVQEHCRTMEYRDDSQSAQPLPSHVEQTCRWALLKTADGGHTWHERPLPAEPATENTGFEYLNPAHSLMFWAPSPGTLALGTADRRYWTTLDGGETWQQAPDPYEVPPAGGVGLLGLRDRPVFLASAPDAELGKWPIVTAADGSYWLTCIPLNEPPPCVTVSRDLGKTWQRMTVHPAEPTAQVTFVATYDGRTVFAGLDGMPNRIMRSEDAGLTWREIPAPSPSAMTGADVLALPNGDLLVTVPRKEGGMNRVRIGGGIEKMAGAPTHTGWMYMTSDVIVAPNFEDIWERPQVPPVAWISSDYGATWIPVPPLAP